MKILIIGSGRLATSLAMDLERSNHTVSVIADQNGFGRLHNFSGGKIEGVPFDKDVLETARIAISDAIAIFTENDEANITIAKIARDIYRVPKVIARIYDPRKASIYEKMGIQTISGTAWAYRRATELLMFDQLESIYEIANGEVEIVVASVNNMLAGRKVSDINVTGEIKIVAIERNNKSFIPPNGTVLEINDRIYISILSMAKPKLKSILNV